MTLREIKTALRDGMQVRWVHDDFHVYQSVDEQCQIVFRPIGAVFDAGPHIIGRPEDFYVMEKEQ